MSIIIGLTGPTGSGKSSACSVALKYGFKFVDCDILARKAVEKGTDGLSSVVKVFGDEILNYDGTLNRKALAKEAFSTKQKTELLNKTLLPHITLLVKKEINAKRVILDAPTLYESGIDSICDAVIAVLADKNVRLKRIIKRDGIDEQSAMLRINAGKMDEYYKSKTRHIIYNNDDENDFKARFEVIINKILKENYCERKD